MTEEWRPVVGHPDYEVSSLGRVRRATPGCGTRVGRLLKPKLSGWGYLEVSLSHKSKYTFLRINRLVCEAFNGPPPDNKPFALHRDDIKSNNIPSNLYWGDRKENGADAKANGCYPRSLKHRLTKVNEETIIGIRRLASEGKHRFRDIADIYGISTSQAHKIARGKYHEDIK